MNIKMRRRISDAFFFVLKSENAPIQPLNLLENAPFLISELSENAPFRLCKTSENAPFLL